MKRIAGAVALAVAIVLPLLVSAPTASSAASAPSTPRPQTPILSARRFPGSLEGAADADLKASLDAFVAKAVGNECIVVEQDGRIVYDHDSGTAFAPASVMKLVTATTALEVLGHERTLDTVVRGPKPAKDGTVKGDVVIVGGGDPILTTKGYVATFDDPDQVVEDPAAIVDRIAEAGVKRIEGSIVGDDSRYDAVREIPTWPSRYVQTGTVAPLSALVVNDGSTGYADAPDKPNSNRRAGDPPLLFAQTLTTMLKARGIDVTGAPRTGRADADANTIATSPSLPMIDLVAEMLTYSDNTTAELLLKEIGLVAKGQGTTSAGIDTATETLRSLGFDTTSLVMHDGSGLDPTARMSCSLALALVERLDTDPVVSAKLPVGGRSGTLRKRMLGSTATGRIRAKTGTLNGVNALTGFAESTQGNRLSFAMLHNGNDTRTTGVGDNFAERVVTYGKGPKISTISPLPAK